MMVGLPGSGKSTIAKTIQRSVPNTVIHSSDDLRGELFGNVNDQSKNNELFIELHKRIKNDLSAGRNVIFDATNLNKKRRASFLGELKYIDCFKQCVLVMVPYEICLQRNEARFERRVLDDVIKRMYMKFQPPYYSEGFDAISIEFYFNIKDSFEKYDIDKLFRSESWFMTFDQENSHHQLPLGEHCRKTSEYFEDLIGKEEDIKERERLVCVFNAALIHDVGKPFTKTRTNAKGEDDGECHYYQHHCVGAYDSFFYFRNSKSSFALDCPAQIEKMLYCSNVIYWHMKPYTSWRQSNKARERDKRIMTEQMYEDVLMLHEADLAAH